MNRTIISFKKDILDKKSFWLVMLFFLTVSYGFSIFNRTISMDDFSYYVFFGENHLDIAGTRWGEELIKKLLIQDNAIPFIGRFFSIIFLTISAILLCFLFYYLTNNKRSIDYSIIASIYLTYPLINELFEFNNYAELAVCLSIVLTSIIIQCFNEDRKISRILLASFVIVPAMAGYESSIFAYVTIVFIILYIKSCNQKYNWFLDGLYHSIPLLIALILRYVIGFLLIWILGLKYSGVGNASIKWLASDFASCAISVLYNGWYYLIRGFSYFPIGEFVLSVIIFIILLVKKTITCKNKDLIIIGFLMLCSLFFLSLLQGEYLHYRNAQTIQFFIPFVVYCLINEIRCLNNETIIKLTIAIMLFVCFRQSVCLNEILSLNNLRSDNEANVFRNIGYQIYSNYDRNKTIIFCGEYQLGNYIEEQITVKKNSLAEKIEKSIREITGHKEERLYQEYICTNVNSYYNTQKDAFNGQIMIKYYLSYLGFDINVLEDLSSEEENYLKYEYEKIAKKEKMKEYEIKDMGDYILVYMGPTIDGINND